MLNKFFYLPPAAILHFRFWLEPTNILFQRYKRISGKLRQQPNQVASLDSRQQWHVEVR